MCGRYRITFGLRVLFFSPFLALIALPSIIMHKYSRDTRISLFSLKWATHLLKEEPQLFMCHFPKRIQNASQSVNEKAINWR